MCARIVQKLGEPIGFRDFTLNTSSSIGVALSPDHGATWQAIYKAADMALYDAKHAGRGPGAGIFLRLCRPGEELRLK